MQNIERLIADSDLHRVLSLHNTIQDANYVSNNLTGAVVKAIRGACKQFLNGELHKYTVTYNEYTTPTEVEITDLTWEEAMLVYRAFQSLIKTKNWSRHPAFKEEVAHLDHYADLYDEGGVRIERQKVKVVKGEAPEMQQSAT